MLADTPQPLADTAGLEISFVKRPEVQTHDTRHVSSASRFISSDRDITFRSSCLNQPGKIALIMVTSFLVLFLAFSFPETLFSFRLYSIANREIGIVIPILMAVPAGISLYVLFRIYDLRYLIGLEAVTKLTGVALFLKTSNLQSYLNEIKSIEVNQSLLQRLCHIGDVQIRSIDSEQPEIVLNGVRNPKMIKSFIEHRRHQLKSQERRFHQESIDEAPNS